MFVFLLLARKSTEEKGGHAEKRLNMCRNRQKDWRKALLLLSTYSCFYRQLVQLAESVVEVVSARASIGIDEKFPTLSCELAIEVFCLNLIISFHRRRLAAWWSVVCRSTSEVYERAGCLATGLENDNFKLSKVRFGIVGFESGLTIVSMFLASPFLIVLYWQVVSQRDGWVARITQLLVLYKSRQIVSKLSEKQQQAETVFSTLFWVFLLC